MFPSYVKTDFWIILALPCPNYRFIWRGGGWYLLTSLQIRSMPPPFDGHTLQRQWGEDPPGTRSSDPLSCEGGERNLLVFEIYLGGGFCNRTPTDIGTPVQWPSRTFLCSYLPKLSGFSIPWQTPCMVGTLHLVLWFANIELILTLNFSHLQTKISKNKPHDKSANATIWCLVIPLLELAK